MRLIRCVREDETLLTLSAARTSYRLGDDFERALGGRSLLPAGNWLARTGGLGVGVGNH